MRTSTIADDGVDQHIQLYLEPLLNRNFVDVAFWAHVHQYERSYPLVNGAVVKPGHGVVHVVVGNAGNTYQVPWEGACCGYGGSYTPPSWLLFRTFAFGISSFKVNGTALAFTFRGDAEYIVHDSFTLLADQQVWRSLPDFGGVSV